MEGQVSLFGQDSECGKTSRAACPRGVIRRLEKSVRGRIFNRFFRRSSKLKNHPFMLLDLRPGAGNMLGPCWEYDPVWLGPPGTLNTSECPRDVVESSLSQILQDIVPLKYYLSKMACIGILRRAGEREKELPSQLKTALLAQAGFAKLETSAAWDNPAHSPVKQRDELRGCLTPWDTQQSRVFTPEGKAPTLTGADDGGGRNPGGVVLTAGFCAGAAPTAGGIGYQEECAPTLKAAESGTNMVPAVLCLNDQGGSVMDCSEDVSGTLRSQEHGHQPLIFENHGIDARYTGPHLVSPTLSARGGTGGNNLPLAVQMPETICISGNIIDRQPQNGGNGLGCQEGIAYTLTAMDHHAVFSRQRVDVLKEDDVASTESARQHKDTTDLVCQPACQETAGEERPLLIRRLIPLECERLQGFPDGWTDLPGASDSARYRALGNSVAIPCVEYIMRRIAMAADSSDGVSSLTRGH